MILFAFQDWANTKAAYRFLSNDRVHEKEILSRHFQSTQECFSKLKSLILVLQDTNTFHPKLIVHCSGVFDAILMK